MHGICARDCRRCASDRREQLHSKCRLPNGKIWLCSFCVPSLVSRFSRKISCFRDRPATCKMLAAQIHSTPPRYDLMEFFDDPKNWSANEVRSGRAWRTDELRIKSNSDLHKLWFVLLKEQNMLLTMEHQCEIESEPFPSPERLDKARKSFAVFACFDNSFAFSLGDR